MFYRIQMAIFRYPKMKFLICYSKKNQWNLKNKVDHFEAELGFFLSRKLDNFIFLLRKNLCSAWYPEITFFVRYSKKKSLDSQK